MKKLYLFLLILAMLLVTESALAEVFNLIFNQILAVTDIETVSLLETKQ